MFFALLRPGRMAGSARAGVAAVHRRLPPLRRGTTWWREILLIGMLYGAYELSRGIGAVNVQSALENGRAILHLERLWHVDPERMLNATLEKATWIAVAASYFYSVMHYLVTPAVLVWMYRKHREHYGTARTALAISTAVGLIGYLLLPTAPPRMLRHSGLRDTLADTQGYGWWGGEGSVPRGLGALTNQFAAMPSMHVGWAIWCGVLVAMFAERRWVKMLGAAYPVTTTVVVLATGNHYLLDAVAGAAVMAVGAVAATSLPQRPAKITARPRRESGDVVAARSRAGERAAAAATTAVHGRARQGGVTVIEAVENEAHLCRSHR